MSLDGRAPTAWVGPVYPAFVAGIYAIFGHRPQVVFLFQIMSAVLMGYLVYLVGVEVIGSRTLSVLSVGALGLYFPLIQHTIRLLTEMLFTLLLALVVYLLVIAVRKRTSWWFALAVLAAGAGALCRPSLLTLPPLLFVVFVFAFRERRWLSVTGTAAFTLAMLVVMAPWTIRNYNIWHRFVPVSTEGGYVLWAGNYGEHGEFGAGRYPYPSHIRKFLDSNPSEVERNDFFTREAIRNIRARPTHFISLAGRKFLRLWFNVGYPRPPSKASLVLMFGHAVLFFFALLSVSVTKNKAGVAVIAAVLLNFTLIHMISYGTVRYALPMMPYVVLLASRGFARFVPGLADARWLPP